MHYKTIFRTLLIAGIISISFVSCKVQIPERPKPRFSVTCPPTQGEVKLIRMGDRTNGFWDTEVAKGVRIRFLR